MIPISWLDIVAGARAAARVEGRDIGGAELDAVRSAAKGIESVLASSLTSPGDTMLFPAAQFDELILVAPNGKLTTVRPGASLAADLALRLPSADGTAGQVLATDGAGNWHWVTGGAGGGGAGTVTSVATGAGLTGGPITGSGTIAVDGTVLRTSGSYADPAWLSGLSAAKLSGALPAISGASLTALPSHAHAGADITSGTLDDARLSGNVALLGAATASFGFDLSCGGDFWALSGNVNGLAGNFANLAITNGATLGSTVAITIPAAGTIGAWTKAYAGQTANLQEWRDSASAVLASISAVGALSVLSFSAAAGTVQKNAVGYNWSQPTADLVLENSTAATGSMGSQSSPALVLHGRQWDSIGAGASKQTGVALYVEAPWAAGNSAQLHVAGQNIVTGAWTDIFVFPSWNSYWGAREGVSYYDFRHKGINNFELGLYIQKLDGLTAGLALGRDAGTNSTYVRSLAAALPILMQDSAGAATQVQAASFSGSGAPLTDLPTWYNNDALMLMGA